MDDVNKMDECYRLEMLPPDVMLARVKETMEKVWEAGARPDTIVIVHSSRGVGKSVWNAEMLRRLLEAESIARGTEPMRIIGIDECAEISEAASHRLRTALAESIRLDRLPEAPRLTAIPRETAQWKREMNEHPAQRRNMHRGQLAQNTYRGRGG
jgi:hypothetical protein